jgi:radical SAM protein with 4Fe4S-binding SPASM domain
VREAGDRLNFFALRNTLDKVGAPISLSCELTYRCQLRCKHCYILDDDPRGAELPLESWVRILDEAEELGVMSLLLTGGEPTLYRPFWELLAEAGRRSFLIHLFTNGYELDEADVDRLVRANVRFVELSLHGADAATQDAVSGVPGSFERIVASTRLLHAAGLFVKLKTSLLKSNHRQLGELEELALALGCSYGVSTFITPDNRGVQRVGGCVIDETELWRAEQTRHNWSPAPVTFKLAKAFLTTIPCSAGISSLAVCPNGDVLPCLQTRYTLGNAARTSLGRIWQHSSRRQYWRGIRNLVHPECRVCEFNKHCNRCAGISLLETGSAWKPSATVCREAGKNAEVIRLMEASQ